MGSSTELSACTRMSSVELMSRMGGLSHKPSATSTSQVCDYLRPSTVHADNATRSETVGVSVLDVGDVPPDFMDTREGGDGSGEEGEDRGPHDDEAVLSVRGAETKWRGRTGWVVEAGRVAARRTKYAAGGIGSRDGLGDAGGLRVEEWGPGTRVAACAVGSDR